MSDPGGTAGCDVRGTSRLACAAALVGALLAPIPALAAPKAGTPSGAGLSGASRPPELPFLPTMPTIKLEASRKFVMVVLDVDVPRGEWASRDLDLFAAFGAPGAPRAVDARLYATGPSGADPGADEVGEAVALEMRSHRPAGAYALLGKSTMAGFVLHLREPSLRRALGASGIARLRLRMLHDLPRLDPEGGREVVIRLGSEHGAPIALDRIAVRSAETRWLAGANAHLCGSDADIYPLAVATATPRPAATPGPQSGLAPIGPSAAVRHASDDLCVRFWTAD